MSWAASEALHPMVLKYLQQRPDHLWSQPPKHEEPFSTPRSWHVLSGALTSFGDAPTPQQWAFVLARAVLPLGAWAAEQFKVMAVSRF